MKKMILTMMAMFSMTMTFAENENTKALNNVEAYDMTVNMEQLSKTLELTKDQVAGVSEVHNTFSAEMVFAAMYGEVDREKMMDKAIVKNLACMHTLLDKNQYRKYVTLLNLTLVNRGLR